MDRIAGEPLATALGRRTGAGRDALLDAAAASIRALHAAGLRHGDLHQGNLWCDDAHVMLLDWQRAGRARRSRPRQLDLARLELSLARQGIGPETRRALRQRLGVEAGFNAMLRSFLRDHLRGRGRRVLRQGRAWQRIEIAGRRGVHVPDLEPAILAGLITECETGPEGAARRGGRTRIVHTQRSESALVVKRSRAGGLRRALADRFRGTPAARAFRAGHRLGLLGVYAPRPLAFLESRRFGIPWQSWLVMEAVGEADLDGFRPDAGEPAARHARALGLWLAELHAWGIAHRDLKAGNLRLDKSGDGGARYWLLDLEDVRLGRRIPQRARRRALAQLNASIADDRLGLSDRRRMLAAYCERMPFDTEPGQLALEIARESLARRHRWKGEGCRAGGLSPSRP